MKRFNFPSNRSATSLTDFNTQEERQALKAPIPNSIPQSADSHERIQNEMKRLNYPLAPILRDLSAASPTGFLYPSIRPGSESLPEAMASFHRSQNLVRLGAYATVTDPKLNSAIRARPQLETFLRQDSHERIQRNDTLKQT